MVFITLLRAWCRLVEVDGGAPEKKLVMDWRNGMADAAKGEFRVGSVEELDARTDSGIGSFSALSTTALRVQLSPKCRQGGSLRAPGELCEGGYSWCGVSWRN